MLLVITTFRDIVNAHMEKTLALLWHLIFGFQLGQILNEERLTKEVAYLGKSLKFKALIGEAEAKTGLHFVVECKQRDLKDEANEYTKDPNDWAKSVKFQLLLQWARLVCAHYGLEVENLSTAFSDGRALCFLVHHYYPAFLPKSDINLNTTQQQMVKTGTTGP
jgi:abnormal spindle-like microcephaly-associated protein